MTSPTRGFTRPGSEGRMSPEDLNAFLALPLLCRLACLDRQGWPYVVPVWFEYGDGGFYIIPRERSDWARYIQRDPRVSLCIEASGPARHVTVDCDAEPVEQDIWTISRELAQKYVGGQPGAAPDAVERFMANMKTEPRLLFRLTPRFWRAIDLTVYRGKRADREFQQHRAGK